MNDAAQFPLPAHLLPPGTLVASMINGRECYGRVQSYEVWHPSAQKSFPVSYYVPGAACPLWWLVSINDVRVVSPDELTKKATEEKEAAAEAAVPAPRSERPAKRAPVRAAPAAATPVAAAAGACA
jgi:hypothetical protein